MNTKSPEDTEVTFREFVILSFLYNISDGVDHVERLHLLSYLLDQELSNDVWVFQYSRQKGILHSSQIDECVEELAKRDQVAKTTSRTFGGDERVSCTITNKGEEVVSESKKIGEFETLNEYISQTVSTYGLIPISNLIEIVNTDSQQVRTRS